MRILNLKTEYKTNPLGIDVKLPRLSWEITYMYTKAHNRKRGNRAKTESKTFTSVLYSTVFNPG